MRSPPVTFLVALGFAATIPLRSEQMPPIRGERLLWEKQELTNADEFPALDITNPFSARNGFGEIVVPVR